MIAHWRGRLIIPVPVESTPPAVPAPVVVLVPVPVRTAERGVSEIQTRRERVRTSAFEVNNDYGEEGEDDRRSEEDIDGRLVQRSSSLEVRPSETQDDADETEEDGEEEEEVEDPSKMEDVGDAMETSLRVDHSPTVVQEVVSGEEGRNGDDPT